MAIDYDELVKILDKQKKPSFGKILAGTVAGGLYGLAGKSVPQQLYESVYPSDENDMQNMITRELLKAELDRNIKPKTIQEQAFEALTTGQQIPGLNTEQMQKAAGVYIAPKEKIAIKEKMQNEPRIANTLRKEFRSQKPVQDYNIINRSYDALESAYKLATDPDAKSRLASDQALGVLFQKMLDPMSVVRESEYARTPEGASFIHRIESIIPQLQKGGLKLTDSDRFAIIQQAKELLNSSQNLAREQKNYYTRLSKQYGINPGMVTGGFPVIPKNLPIEQEQQQPRYIRTGTDSATGKRVGMLPDGTIEEIQ
jgi:hypothetical protein